MSQTRLIGVAGELRSPAASLLEQHEEIDKLNARYSVYENSYIDKGEIHQRAQMTRSRTMHELGASSDLVLHVEKSLQQQGLNQDDIDKFLLKATRSAHLYKAEPSDTAKLIRGSQFSPEQTGKALDQFAVLGDVEAIPRDQVFRLLAGIIPEIVPNETRAQNTSGVEHYIAMMGPASHGARGVDDVPRNIQSLFSTFANEETQEQAKAVGHDFKTLRAGGGDIAVVSALRKKLEPFEKDFQEIKSTTGLKKNALVDALAKKTKKTPMGQIFSKENDWTTAIALAADEKEIQKKLEHMQHPEGAVQQLQAKTDRTFTAKLQWLKNVSNSNFADIRAFKISDDLNDDPNGPLKTPPLEGVPDDLRLGEDQRVHKTASYGSIYTPPAPPRKRPLTTETAKRWRDLTAGRFPAAQKAQRDAIFEEKPKTRLLEGYRGNLTEGLDEEYRTKQYQLLINNISPTTKKQKKSKQLSPISQEIVVPIYHPRPTPAAAHSAISIFSPSVQSTTTGFGGGAGSWSNNTGSAGGFNNLFASTGSIGGNTGTQSLADTLYAAFSRALTENNTARQSLPPAQVCGMLDGHAIESWFSQKLADSASRFGNSFTG